MLTKSDWPQFKLPLLLLCLSFWLAVTTAVHADGKRVALLVGNSDYKHVANLPNARNDASNLADALKRIGFTVWHYQNLDYRGLRIALRDFGRAASGADMAFVYFAGHGIEIDNTNYLIPVNSELRSDQDIEFEAIQLDTVISSLSGADGLKVVLVDACRNNPFLSAMRRESGTRSIGRGLGRIDPSGVLVSYAAKGGTLALEGEGRNSPYATALLEHIEEPGLELGKMFRKVRDTVYNLTDGFQEPFTYGSLPSKDIFLIPATALPPPKIPAAGSDRSQIYADFELARSLGTLDAVESFLNRYQDQSDHFAVTLALSLRDDLRQAAPQQNTPDKKTDASPPQVAAVQPPDDPKADPQTRDLIRDIQTELNRVGCNAGTADGVAGPRTRSAFSRYRSARQNLGLPANGLDQQRTLAALRREQGRVCSAPEPAPVAGFDGEYVILVRRRWDDDYWQTATRGDEAYFPGKIEPLAELRISRKNGKVTLTSAQAFTGGGPWFRDFAGSLQDTGQLKLRFTLSSHFAPPVTPYKVRIDVKLPQGLQPGKRLVYEPRRIDGQFFLNFMVRRAH